MNKPLFSCCLIARNESKTLPRLIKSLQEFQSRGGEIIVLDTGSTDNTVEIARGLGAHVIEVGDKFRIIANKETADAINSKYIIAGETPIIKSGDSNFDYASARNYAASLASNDMIAMPDCDTVYTAFDIDALNKEIENGAKQFENAFVFAHDESGKPLIEFRNCQFYNRANLKWIGIIHEVLSGHGKKVSLDASVLKLEHWQNHETNREHYLTGLALDCYLNPDNDRNTHYFARELYYKKYYHSAIKHFKVHIAMDKWVEEKAQSAIYIGDCYKFLGDMDEAFKWYTKALDISPNRREALMKLAEHYYHKNSPKHVIIYTTAALTVTGTSFYSNYQPYYEHYPHELLYWAYWYAGNKVKSKEHYDIAYSYLPNNSKYLGDRVFYYPEESKDLNLQKKSQLLQVNLVSS